MERTEGIEQLRHSEPAFLTTSDNTTLAYWKLETRGGRNRPDTSRPSVVWVHANGFSGRLWLPVIESTSCRDPREHLVYDLRGQGRSSKPEPTVANYEWGRQAEDLLELVRAAAEAPVDVVGHSMGAAIAVLAAAEQPELFRSLALFEPIIFVAERLTPMDPEANPLVSQARRRKASFSSVEECRQRLGAKPPYSFWSAEAFEIYLESALLPDAEGGEGGVVLACPPEVEATNYICGALHDGYERLASLTRPVLLMQGSRSPKGGPLDAQGLLSRLADGTYREVPNATHFAPFEAPRAFAEVLCEFWAGIQAPAAR